MLATRPAVRFADDRDRGLVAAGEVELGVKRSAGQVEDPDLDPHVRGGGQRGAGRRAEHRRDEQAAVAAQGRQLRLQEADPVPVRERHTQQRVIGPGQPTPDRRKQAIGRPRRRQLRPHPRTVAAAIREARR
jgi:hypothetical protein